MLMTHVALEAREDWLWARQSMARSEPALCSGRSTPLMASCSGPSRACPARWPRRPPSPPDLDVGLTQTGLQAAWEGEGRHPWEGG